MVTDPFNAAAAVGLVVNKMVKEVVVAAVTLPTAPPANVTALLLTTGLKPNPLTTRLVPLSDRLIVLAVTTGLIVATCTAIPLAPLVVTVAKRLPAMGLVEIETVSDVGVESVTVPTAPLLNVTTLLAVVVSKPEPAIVSVVRLAAKLVVAVVITGFSDATWTANPFETSFEVTTAVRIPAVGAVVILTVSAVADEAVTVPTAPWLNTTVLLLAVVSKPNPLMVMVVAFKARLAVLRVTTGFTSAISTAEPLLTPPVVTTAVKLPARVGLRAECRFYPKKGS